MTDCLLHIGVEKTGTTSIQATMSRNRRMMSAAGVLYPQSLGERNHIKAYAYASEGDIDELKSPLGLNNPGSIEGFREQVRTQLATEIAQNKPKKIIISNEHCSSRLVKHSEIERLAGLLLPLCATVTVIAYVRRQGEALRSAYSTYIKTGGTSDFVYPDEEEIRRKYDYESILDRWAMVFGDENLDVRVFSRERMAGGDVVTDFLTKTGLTPTNCTVVREMNKSLGRVGIEFMRQFNRVVPYTSGDDFNPARGNIQEIVEDLKEDWPYTGDPGVIARLDDELAESNERVRRRYMGELPGPLFPPPITTGAPVTGATIGADDIMRVMAFVWEAKQQQVLRLRKRLEGASVGGSAKAQAGAGAKPLGAGDKVQRRSDPR